MICKALYGYHNISMHLARCYALTLVSKAGVSFQASHYQTYLTILSLQYITTTVTSIITFTKFTMINAFCHNASCMRPSIYITI